MLAYVAPVYINFVHVLHMHMDMATIKILLKSCKFMPRLTIQVLHAGKTEILNSNYRLHPECFNETTGRVLFQDGLISRAEIRRINNILKSTTRLLKQRIALLEASKLPYTVNEICEGIDFQGEKEPTDLFTFFRIQIAIKAVQNKYASQQLYSAAFHSLQKYAGRTKCPFHSLSREFTSGFLEYLNKQKLSVGTISKYMTVLHTVCMRAAYEGAEIKLERLFSKLRPSAGRSAKRAVDKAILSKIAHLKLDDQPSLKYASDLFLFSFFAQGMSLVDILHLRKDNIQNGVIRYVRAKCGTRISLGITPQMKRIIELYCPENSREAYIFPSLRGIKQGTDVEYKAYRAALRATNRALLKISQMLHLDVPLTTYVARHTWATNAKKARIPIPVIQEALGHTSIRTTEIYLKEFETQMIERINERITRL